MNKGEYWNLKDLISYYASGYGLDENELKNEYRKHMKKMRFQVMNMMTLYNI